MATERSYYVDRRARTNFGNFLRICRKTKHEGDISTLQMYFTVVQKMAAPDTRKYANNHVRASWQADQLDRHITVMSLSVALLAAEMVVANAVRIPAASLSEHDRGGDALISPREGTPDVNMKSSLYAFQRYLSRLRGYHQWHILRPDGK